MHVQEIGTLPHATEETLRETFGFPAVPEAEVSEYQRAEVEKIPYSASGVFLQKYRDVIQDSSAALVSLCGFAGALAVWIGVGLDDPTVTLWGLAILILTTFTAGLVYYLYWYKTWLLPAVWETQTLADYMKTDDARSMPPTVRTFADAVSRIDPKHVQVFVRVLKQNEAIIDPILKVVDYRVGTIAGATFGPIWKDGKLVTLGN